MNPNTKLLLGALVAAGLAIAGYYGLVSPQMATNIQNQANQALGTGPQQRMAPAPNAVPQAQPAPTSQASTVPPPSAPAPQPAPSPPH